MMIDFIAFNVIMIVSRGQAGKGEWREHSGENLLSSDRTHPKQVRDQCLLITFNVHISRFIIFFYFYFFFLYLFCSEDILELSIMPKDEDVLQLVSVSIIFLLFSLLSCFSPCYKVQPLQLARLLTLQHKMCISVVTVVVSY